MQGERGPAPPAALERAVPVHVVTAERRTVVPRAVGFGVVQPSRTFTATAETSGRIVERHPQLERGRVLPAGTRLFRLDDADLRLTQARTEAELQRLAAEVRRIEVRRDNLTRTLDLETRALAIAEVELERQRDLLRRGTTSRTIVDQAETNYLTRLDRLQNIEAGLAEIEPELAVRAAERAVREAELRQAALDLERSELFLPFDARVAEVMVEGGHYVARGQALAELDAVDHAEIDAQFSLSQLRPLIAGTTVAEGRFDLTGWQNLPERVGLRATVTLRERDFDVSWSATFDRPSDRIDPETRTLGVIVRVADPYGQARPGERPPLTKNMHVQVQLEGRPRADLLVVPAGALRRSAGETLVYVADADDRLRLRPVRLDVVLDDLAVIEAGLEEGERVVVGPLAPAIEGMKLAPAPIGFDGATRISELRP